MNWTEEDIKEREKKYKKSLSKVELLQDLARKLPELKIREDGFVIHDKSKKVLNPKAFKYRTLAEMREKYNVKPKRFIKRVIQEAL